METAFEMKKRHFAEKTALLIEALTKADGNQAAAARMLGLDRGRFIQDFKYRVGLKPGEFVVPPRAEGDDA